MDDLRSRFASLDAVAVPDLRAEIDRRAAALADGPITRVATPHISWRATTARGPLGRRFAGIPALVVLALLLLGVAVAVGSGLIRLPWFLEPPLPWPLQGVLEPTGSIHNPNQVPTAVVLADGRVLVTIPHLDNKPFNENAEVWDPATGQFEIVGPMARQREEPRTVLLRDGRVLLIGSIGAEQTAEVFDPATNTFSLLASAPTTVEGTAVLLRDGRVLISGGYQGIDDESGDRPIAATAEIFNPVTNEFHPVGPMQRPRAFHDLHLLPDGRVLVLGGQLAFGQGWEQPFAEIFDPVTNAFEMAARPPFTESLPDWSARLNDGTLVYLVQPGWGQHPDRSLPMTVLFYDLATGAQSNGPTIPATAPVYDVRQILALTDNRLLLVGFDKSTHQLDEFGDLSSGWIGVLDLHSGVLSEVARRHASWGTAVPLPDGRVMLVGGIGRTECTFEGTTSPCMDSTTAVDILR